MAKQELLRYYAPDPISSSKNWQFDEEAIWIPKSTAR